MMVAVLVIQIFHHHWSKTAGTTVDGCHDVSLHLCIMWEQMLLGCQLLSRSVGRSSIWAAFGGDKICLMSSNSSQLRMGHTEQPVTAIVPNLFLVQLLGKLPELRP